ncbi:MAG: hypothetical protein JST59_00425 [Actinobacteria bacterium]|nr:hypothetical protein [Actinomycetota bacterium]
MKTDYDGEIHSLLAQSWITPETSNATTYGILRLNQKQLEAVVLGWRYHDKNRQFNLRATRQNETLGLLGHYWRGFDNSLALEAFFKIRNLSSPSRNRLELRIGQKESQAESFGFSNYISLYAQNSAF